MARSVLVLATLCCSLSCLATTSRYIRSATSSTCPSEPCLTLSDYVSNNDLYFTSNTSFILLEGEHYLNSSLLLRNVFNVTMSGAVATRVTIILLTEASLSYINSHEIVFSSLDIVCHGKGETLSQSALIFEDSQAQIVNIKFTGFDSNINQKSRSISFIQSTASIINCSFSNGQGDYGGAVSLQRSSTIAFSNIDFINNTATMRGGAIFANNSKLTFTGGILFLRNKIDSTKFQSRSLGGGAIFISQTNVHFINGFTNFIDNGPKNAYNISETIFGGAILMQQNSTIQVQGAATFNNNSGDSGGAVFSVNSSFSLSGNVKFIDNNATYGYGGAISAYTSDIHFHEDVVFEHNNAITGGAIFIENSEVECLNNVTFACNTARFRGGGVYAIASTVVASGKITFIENVAEGDGGGMGLEGFTSQLVLQEPITVNFYYNKANLGGALFYLDSNAMYIDQCQLITVERKLCFFTGRATDVSNMRIHMNFIENYASASGSVLYGGALQLCQVLLSENIYIDGLQYFESISVLNHSTNSTYISSNPLKVCFCNDGNIDCSENKKKVQVTRGELFNISLVAVGIFDVPVTSRVRAVAFDNNATIIPPSHITSGVCTNIGFRLLTKEDNNIVQMTLFPDGPCVNVSSIHKSIEVMLDPCPPGFVLKDDHCECEKRLLDLDVSTNCDIDTGLINRPGYSWIQPILDENHSYSGFIVRDECAFDYCKPSQDIVFLNFSTDINDDQCAMHRTGTLCGACKEGYSLTLYNFQCKNCENRYISLLLFFGFAGIALIVLLLALHMTIAAGTINGLILYANIVNICRDIFLPFRNTNVNLLSVFISWVNLDFGIPTCFYNGLDAYAYSWFQFVFPFYLWLLIGFIIFSSKLSSKVGKLLGSNPVAVLATVILMSFTKLLDTTIGVLSHRFLEFPDGSNHIVWSYDGNLAFFRGRHAILAVAAICVIIFLLFPYIFLLTFGYRLQAYSGKKCFFWFNRFKPLLDAYYAPYNKKTRYWTGFLLLVRTCLFFTFLLNDVTFNYIAIEVSSLFTTIAVIAWLSNRVYEKLYVDILEASFILNVCILTSASFHVQTTHGNQAALTYLSIGIAFVEFIGIVIFHLCLRLKNIKIFQSWKCMKYAMNVKKSINKTEPERHDSVLSTNNVMEIREPLLEDD